MNPRRVVITGMGVVAPNGNNLSEFESSLRLGKSGIRFIQELKDLNFGCHVGGVPEGIEELKSGYFSNEELFALNSSMIFSGIAGIDAWKDAGLPLPAWDEDVLYEDTGAIIGTGIGGIDTIGGKVIPLTLSGQNRRLGSTSVEQTMASSVSARFGGLFALGNQVTTNSSACSTGTESLIMGFQRIRSGLARRMLVGGAEGYSPFAWTGFDAMKVLNRSNNDKPSEASRPMSQSARGFVPGCGAGILVLEDLESALARGARIYAEVLGGAITCGGMRRGGSMTMPSPAGVQRCIRQAILDAEISSSEIDYINGHLTATGADPQEINSWAQALELPPEKFPPINSTKSMIGHALGAAGAIESIATVLQMRSGFIHGSLNCEDLHDRIQHLSNSVVHHTKSSRINIAAKASFGFGDVNSCVVFQRHQ